MTLHNLILCAGQNRVPEAGAACRALAIFGSTLVRAPKTHASRDNLSASPDRAARNRLQCGPARQIFSPYPRAGAAGGYPDPTDPDGFLSHEGVRRLS
jgi:hypothetical protein